MKLKLLLEKFNEARKRKYNRKEKIIGILLIIFYIGIEIVGIILESVELYVIAGVGIIVVVGIILPVIFYVCGDEKNGE